MHVETSGAYGHPPYTLTSPTFSECVGEVRFAYHMYGAGMGTLALEQMSSIDNTWTTLWSKTGDQIYCGDTDGDATDSWGDVCSPWYVDNPSDCGAYDDDDFTASTMCCGCDDGWRTASVQAAWYTTQVRFSATTGDSWYSDMAIDNFNVGLLEGCGFPSPAPTATLSPTPAPSPMPTYSPTVTFAPTDTRPQLELTGACAYQTLNDVYEPISQTAGSANSAPRVYYKGLFTDTYLFYDPDCDGTSTASPIWMLSATEPNTTVAADLDGDGACCLLYTSPSPRDS